MKKTVFLLLALLCAGMVYGQNKEIAVWRPKVIGGGNVSANDQLIITSSMKRAFNQIDGYEAYTRTNQTLIAAEQAFQNSGQVDDRQIKEAGRQTGVAYICAFTLAKERNELVVNSDIINVVTGKIENTDFIVLLDVTDRADVMKQCQELAYTLLGVSSAGTSSSRSSSAGNSRQAAGKNLTFTANGVTFEMIFIEGGTFVMGCTSEQSDCGSDERPTHSVSLSDYYMGKYQVTQQLWRAVMGTNVRQQRDLADTGWPLRGEGDDYPMYYINYNECEEFCAKLNKILSSQLPEGAKFRLPTEAQWEYAARGGKKSKGYKFSGGDYIGEVAWYDGNSGAKTHEVGMKDKNELGIYDMSGNVWEWCQDWYDENYYGSSPSSNPKGPGSGSYRVLRGGSWNTYAQNCRVAFRYSYTSSYRDYYYGFRLSLVP